MKKFRIAVCMSGQARTWRSAENNIRRFFNVKKIDGITEEHEVQVDYFCHTWDHNSWWRGDKWSPDNDEPLSSEELEDFKTVFDAKRVEITPHQHRVWCRMWDSLFYSFMRSIRLKAEYELEHDFEYDLVIKARYDIIYNPNVTFPARIAEPLVAVTSSPMKRFPSECYWVDFHDVLFWGDSPTMDMIGDLSRYYRLECNPTNLSHYMLDNTQVNNEACFKSGPGTLLYRHIIDCGIRPETQTYILDHWPVVYSVLREDAVIKGLDTELNYEQIREIYLSMYK
jgi:hypothetical protein